MLPPLYYNIERIESSKKVMKTMEQIQYKQKTRDIKRFSVSNESREHVSKAPQTLRITLRADGGGFLSGFRSC